MRSTTFEELDARMSLIQERMTQMLSDNLIPANMALKAQIMDLTLSDYFENQRTTLESADEKELAKYWRNNSPVAIELGLIEGKILPNRGGGRPPQAGTPLREELVSKLKKIGVGVKVTGRVRYENNKPDLSPLKIKLGIRRHPIPENDEKKEAMLREICQEYNISMENVTLTWKNASGHHRHETGSVRYDRWY